MPVLPLQNFTTLVQSQAAAIQGKVAQLTDFTVGSVLRALVEANAGVALWVQWLILLVLQASRLQTSTGADVDTYVQDFGLARLPAVFAVGSVTFSRIDATNAAFIPAGATLQTGDGTQTYIVIPDAANVAYNTVLNGFTIPSGTSSLNCLAQAAVVGSSGNVNAGVISLLGTAISGVDSVSNPAPFTNGADAESDAALRARFPAYLLSLPQSTVAAVMYAVTSVQTGLTASIAEGFSAGLTPTAGSILITVDDGTGTPSSALLAAVSAAVNAARPVGIKFAVQAPTVVTVAVTLTAIAAPGYTHAQLVAPITNALQTYINSLPVGTALPWTRIIQIAYDAFPGAIQSLTGVSANGSTADVGGTLQQVVKAGVISVL